MYSAKSDSKKGCRVRLRPGRNCTLAAFILSLGATPALAQFVEAQKLAVSDETAAEWFGRSVSVSGNTAVVGEASDACAAGLRCGSVHVLGFNGTSWIAEQKLTASDAAANNAFGTSVSQSVDTVVVGALNDDCVAGLDCGSAYVFRFNGTSWVEEQKLTASDAAAFDQFGYSTSVSGETAVVGAFQTSCAAGAYCGSAYVYRRSGTSWVQEQELTASDAEADDLFGWSVSVSGETIVVGAWHRVCNSGPFCGTAYVYRFNGTSWVETQKLVASDEGGNDWFGRSVYVSSDTAIVGAPAFECMAGTLCGSAYVFRFNGTSWVQEQKLTASDAAADDWFGMSVSVSGKRAVVGARDTDCADGVDCGSAYVYWFDGNSWVDEQKLTASDVGEDDWFGYSVSVSGETILVGAPTRQCTAGVDCGVAYVFRGPSIPAVSTWGLASLSMLLLVAGTIAIRRAKNSSALVVRSIQTRL